MRFFKGFTPTSDEEVIRMGQVMEKGVEQISTAHLEVTLVGGHVIRAGIYFPESVLLTHDGSRRFGLHPTEQVFAHTAQKLLKASGESVRVGPGFQHNPFSLID